MFTNYFIVLLWLFLRVQPFLGLTPSSLLSPTERTRDPNATPWDQRTSNCWRHRRRDTERRSEACWYLLSDQNTNLTSSLFRKSNNFLYLYVLSQLSFPVVSSECLSLISFCKSRLASSKSKVKSSRFPFVIISFQSKLMFLLCSPIINKSSYIIV